MQALNSAARLSDLPTSPHFQRLSFAQRQVLLEPSPNYVSTDT